jgi:hypothetical protein
MGIKRLFQFCKKAVPDAFVEVDHEFIVNKKIAIDLSVFIHRCMRAPDGNVAGRVQSFVTIMSDCDAWYVTEGTRPSLKRCTNACATQHDGRYDEVLAIFETELASRNLKERLIRAPGEAEHECVKMQSQGLVEFIASEDSDLIMLPTVQRMIRGLLVPSRVREVIDVGRIVRGLGLTRKQMVDVALMAGSDYTHGANNIGVVKAVRLVKLHGSYSECIQRKCVTTLDTPERLTSVIDFLQDQIKP